MAKRKVDAAAVPASAGPDHGSDRADAKRILTESDLEALIDDCLADQARQEGEYSVREIADKKHISMSRARDLLEKFVADGKATKRKVGREMLYRMV